MAELATTQHPMGARVKLAVVSLLLTFGALVSVVSAATLDLSGVTDLIDEIVLIMPAMVAMIIAAVPVIIIIALAAFILGFLDQILANIRGH